MSAFQVVLNNIAALRLAMFLLTFLFIPAFAYGVASLWAIAFLFVFVRLARELCQASLRRYEKRLSYTNEAPKMKGIVVELCAYLSLPFIAYIFIVGDINAAVSSGLDRAVVLSLPLEVIKLPIDGDPSVFQMLLVFQLLLSIFGLGGGMLYARKEIAAMSLPGLPKNIHISDKSTKEEWKQHNKLWGTYYFLGGTVAIPAIFSLVFAMSFFGRFWSYNDIYVFEYVFVLPSVIFMPCAIFSVFFAIAFQEIAWSRND
ncbi:MAG: hypothetical protein GW778_01185 [Alphaproteobacteria bacterium]|nr:hypothetical protein [Alphaproteobacteria bacterium]